MKRTFDFGKINYTGSGRRYPVTVEVELKRRGGEKTFTVDRKTGERTYTGNTTPEYVEFSACGNIWNTTKTDIVCGGQCLDTIAKYVKDPVFKEIHKLWQQYHLNGMHAGTPEQEKAIEEWKAAGNKYDYTAVCEYLKSIDLYEVNYTGLSIGRRYENEPYRYGRAWLIQEIPGDALLRIEHMLSTGTEA